MAFVLTVSDDNGNVLFSKGIAEPSVGMIEQVRREAGSPDMSKAEVALALGAPEYCPYDCDYCRGE